MRLLALAAAVCLAACGGSSNSGSGNGGPPAAGQHKLTIHIAGPGQVAAATPAFTCTSDCQQTIDASQTVQLTATPGAAATFSGWSGACSGTGACSVSMASDMDVTATFAQGQSNGTLVTVQLVGTGHGQVTSQPTGIDCPGSCAMTVGSAPVTLTAKPDATSTFAGYGGACSGTSCVLTAASGSTVFVNFVANLPPPPADECAGILPSALGPEVSGTVVAANTSKIFCSEATSDGQGNIMAMSGGFTGGLSAFFTPAGVQGAKINAGSSLVPLASGFQSISTLTPELFTTWSPSGAVVSQIDLGNEQVTAGSNTLSFPAQTGGSVAIHQSCNVPAGPASAVNRLVVARIDESGKLVSSVDLGGPGCLSVPAALGDAFDRTLVVITTDGSHGLGLQPNTIYARWLNRDGTSITGWFEVAALTSINAGWAPRLEPLIGGGVVLSTETVWVAAFSSGTTTVSPVPSFLKNGHDVKIVRGGKAYAVFPEDGPLTGDLEVFAASGKSCGTLPVKAGTMLQVGRDGTVIALDSSAGCSAHWWSGLLK